MTPDQCRAARALLNWNAEQLAEKSYASASTVRNFEAGRSVPKPIYLDAMQKAFEAAGVVFLPAEDGQGAGVRFRNTILTS